MRLFQARELWAGRLPFWNPYINEGAFVLPALYPLELLHALFPGPAAVSWLLTLHLPLAALAAFVLARDLGLSRQAAAFAGALYAAGGLAVSSLSLYVFLQALAWAPLLIVAARRAALARGVRPLALLAAVAAIALSTMAVEFVAQAMLAALVLAWVAAPAGRTLRRVTLGLALGAGLAAVPLLVTAGFLGETVRGEGFSPAVALGNELHPLALLQVLVPDLFGPLSQPGIGWWGWAFFSKGFPYFASLYLGAVPLALAAAGWRGLPRGPRLALGALGLLGLWYALGAFGGLAPALSGLPPFRFFRFPGKALFLPYLAVVLFAGAGYDRLRAGGGWGRTAALLAGLGALCLLPAAVVAGHARWLRAAALVPEWADRTLIATSVMAAGLAGCAALLALAARRRWVGAPLAVALLAFLSVLDLARAHAGLNPQVSPRFYEPLPEMAALRLGESGRVFTYGPDESPAFQRFLQSGAEGTGLWSFFLNRQLLAPYNNVLDRVATAEDKDLTSLVPSPNTLGPGDRDPARVGAILGVLRNAAVAHVVSLDALHHPDLAERAAVLSGLPGLVLHVYELARPWPLAALACRVRAAPDRAQAMLLPLGPGFDPQRDVVLEGTDAPPAGCSRGSVETLERGAARARFVVESDGPGYLLLRESFARGWSATVDGQAAAVRRANGRHRAIALPAGRHEVRLDYRAPGLVPGLALMALSLLAWVGLVASPAATGGEGEARPRPAGPLALVCPACGAALLDASGERACSACGARYPERDGILMVTTTHAGTPAYDPHYFDTLPQVENRHFWFLARREVIADGIKAALPDWAARPLFDIGCGTGGLLAHLSAAGIPVAGGCDAYVRAVESTRRRLDVPLLLVNEDGPPPLAPGQAALAMFDVLEHIDDDEAALRWMYSVLEPGGALVLTVPAHPFLFGAADRMAHHRRRYTRRELRSKLRAAGFEVHRLTHFMAPLVPLLALGRGLARLLGREEDKDAELRVRPGLNGLLRLILRGERLWLRAFGLPFGSSLLAVARRPPA